MSRVMILSTGGTIAMDVSGASSGALPALEGKDFLARLSSHLPQGLQLEVEDILNIPSAFITLENMSTLCQRVRHHLGETEITGIVITHGTDTMEESAYCLDLCVASPAPVVFTGAMRSANEVGYEGLRNLLSAVTVAASSQARGLGVLLVMNEQIHTAAEVRKLHTQRVDAFQSPPGGPLGEVAFGRVAIRHRPLRKSQEMDPVFAVPVPLVGMTADIELPLLQAVQEMKVKGLVLEALGGGRLPPKILPILGQLLADGTPVVLATRSGIGPLMDGYGYEGAHAHLRELGCCFAHHLSGPKARIQLMLALGNGITTPEGIQALFEGDPVAEVNADRSREG